MKSVSSTDLFDFAEFGLFSSTFPDSGRIASFTLSRRLGDSDLDCISVLAACCDFCDPAESGLSDCTDALDLPDSGLKPELDFADAGLEFLLSDAFDLAEDGRESSFTDNLDAEVPGLELFSSCEASEPAELGLDLSFSETVEPFLDDFEEIGLSTDFRD